MNSLLPESITDFLFLSSTADDEPTASHGQLSTKLSLRILMFSPTQSFHDQSLLQGAWLYLESFQKGGLGLLVDPEEQVTSAIVSQSQGR